MNLGEITLLAFGGGGDGMIWMQCFNWFHDGFDDPPWPCFHVTPFKCVESVRADVCLWWPWWWLWTQISRSDPAGLSNIMHIFMNALPVGNGSGVCVCVLIYSSWSPSSGLARQWGNNNKRTIHLPWNDVFTFSNVTIALGKSIWPCEKWIGTGNVCK